jgi:putative ATP-dependent endonuclease of the OLD family
MRIRRARIQNFRCLEDVKVFFDNVTTFIGPNGVGKSSVLRGLDWFFNGDKSLVLTDEDVLHGASEQRIRIEVEFDSLRPEDRAALGKYAPESSDSVVIWRTWEGGQDKITSKAFAYPAFEEIRRLPNAASKKTAYNQLRATESSLDLPSASTQQAIEDAMSAWERSNPDQLSEAEVSDTNFFGFAGQGKMSGLFDFVLVTADLRASEEAQDTKSAVLGKIIERTIDRATADEELVALSDQFRQGQSNIHARHFGSQLDTMSQELSEAVAAFTRGRTVKIRPLHSDMKPPKAQFSVSVVDNQAETRVDRQGHGFQRALLIAALKLLAERGAASDSHGVICLAIEEPELFQHPVQARAFATVLRRLAEDKSQQIQITYATHSPYFIEATHFDQIRRVSRSGSGEAQKTAITSVTLQQVIEHLNGYLSEETIRRRLDDVCLARLPEALFAEVVVLVEGDTDRAVIEGCGERDGGSLAVEGIVVAEVGGKDILFMPHAILTLLGIPCYIVFDGDKGCGDRMRQRQKSEADVLSEQRAKSRKNRELLRYLGKAEEDWPSTGSHNTFAVFSDRLEEELSATWPGWVARRQELVDSGTGFLAKNTATYRYVALTTTEKMPDVLHGILTAARNLRG